MPLPPNPNSLFIIKESWPRGPGFDFTPEGWCLPLNNQYSMAFDFGPPPADYL